MEPNNFNEIVIPSTALRGDEKWDITKRVFPAPSVFYAPSVLYAETELPDWAMRSAGTVANEVAIPYNVRLDWETPFYVDVSADEWGRKEFKRDIKGGSALDVEPKIQWDEVAF